MDTDESDSSNDFIPTETSFKTSQQTSIMESEPSEANDTSVNDLSSINESDYDSDYERMQNSSSLKISDKSQSESQSVELETKSLSSSSDSIYLNPEERLHQCQRQARILIINDEKDAAITEYIRCLALARIVYGVEHWCLAQAHVILAESYLDLKNYTLQALEHGENAKKIILLWKQPPRSPHKRRKFLYVLVNVYLIIGRTQTILQKHSIAEKHLQKAKKLSLIYIESVENNHKANFLKCKICKAMAKFFYAQQMFTEAVVECKEALNLMEVIRGKNALAMILTYQQLGTCYLKMKDYSAAENQFIEAINLSKKTFGVNSNIYVESELLLAQNYISIDTNSAKESAENILKTIIDKMSSAKDTSLDLQAVDILFSCLISSGRDEEAKELLENNLSKRCNIFGQASSEVILTLRLLGSLCLTLDEPETAAKYLRKCYDREFILYGSNHPRVKNTKLALELVCQTASVSSKYRVLSPLSMIQTRPRFVLL